MQNLIEKLDQILDLNVEYATDKKIQALIYLDICELVSNEFDFEQKNVLCAARNYWTFNELKYDDERKYFLEQLRTRKAKISMVSPYDQNRVQLFDWLLLGALTTDIGFSSYDAEYIINFADRLEINKDQIIKIFERHIPKLSEFLH